MAPPRPVPPRPGSLAAQIQDVGNASNDDIANLMAELSSLEEEAVGFRHNADATQESQDRTLRRYEGFLRATKLLPEDASEDERWEIMFPTDFTVLYRQTRLFILFIVPRTRGRASKDALCTYQSLTSYRSGLLFYANHSYCLRRLQPPPRGVLFHGLTEALRFAAKKYNISLYGDINNSHVGLSELSQLIDLDMEDTKCIELAEMHHLAWCVGRVCAIRPGSLGYNPKNKNSLRHKKYLTWRDVKIFRGVEKAEFVADFTFRILKTNSEDPEEGNNDDRPPRPLQCRVLSPKKNENVIFSVPHRLLVIALRRGIIDGISTIDELLAGRALNIQWKASAMDEPIFQAGSHRGLSVSDAPMSSVALTEYLRTRGQRIGYIRTITFYSLRRRTATDFTLLLGADHARRLLGHGPSTRTLERYYLNDVNRTNLSGMALSETTNPRITDNTQFYTDLSTTAVGAEEVREIYGGLLNEAVSNYIAEDPLAPRDGSVREYNNYRRRVSRLVFKSLLQERSKRLEASLTQSEAEERIKKAATNSTMEDILRRARAMSELQLDNEPIPGMLPEGGFEETFIEGPPEIDLDTQPIPADRLFVRETDEEAMESPTGDVPYTSCVRLTMELLLEFHSQPHAVAGESSILPRPRVNDSLTCAQCQEEDYVDDAHKNRVWPSRPHLQRHLDSDFHSPLRVLQRKIQYRYTMTGKWLCPFCEELEHPRTIDYGCVGKVTRHIETSGNSLHVWGHEHEQLKNNAGFNQTWRKNANGGASARVRYSRKKRAEGFAQRTKLLRSYGILYTSGERPPVNQPTGHRGVVTGDQSEPLNSDDLAAFEELTPIDEIPPNIKLDDDLEGCFISSTSPMEIPQYLSTQFLAEHHYPQYATRYNAPPSLPSLA